MEEERESNYKELTGNNNYLWLLFDLLMVIGENLLALRVVLKFLGVSALNPVVYSFYLFTDFFVKAGLNAFPKLNVATEHSVFEGSTILLFFLVYALHHLVYRRKKLRSEVVNVA